MLFHALSGNRDGGKAQLGNRPVGFLDGGGRILQRHQSDSFEPRALFANIRDKIVISAGVGDRVVALHHAVHGKAAGREQH